MVTGTAMVQDGEITLEDAKRALRRHWWILPTCAIGCLGIAAGLVEFLPKQFTSETLVLVRQPTVPTDVVKPVVTEDLNQRLASMQEQILSRSRLEPLINRFNLFPSDRMHRPIEDLIVRLRDSIEVIPVQPMQGTRDNSLPGFHVAVTLGSSRLAQQVCTEITSMFLEQNSRAREQQAAKTTSFLSGQLEDAKAKLDEQDARLAKFKSRYLGALPEQEQTNLSLLSGLNSQLEANTQALGRAQQDKVFNQTLLDQEASSWRGSQAGRNPVTLDQELATLQGQLVALQAKYTDEYPDVIKLKNHIQDLKKQIAASATNSRGSSAEASQPAANEPPEIKQLRAKVQQDDVSISGLVAQQAKIQEEIRVLEGRIQSSPAVEQQFKELTRNYQTALDFYHDLLRRRENSAMATDLEHQQESELRVLDPPNLPSEASFPKKKLFAAGGLSAGLALGLGILFLIAISDRSMHTERDIEVFLKLPVLTSVPVLGNQARKNGGDGRKRVTFQVSGTQA
ncbi:MAG: lipopolysaccharide biosynthesis protein [Acidobacteria bacterium]|nr:MAG: lipopolysaccharide biosynthesis protein [Acidobacteriota bacterium]